MKTKKPHGNAKPNKKQLIEIMLEEIATGKSLTKVCNEILHIEIKTVYNWFRTDAELVQQYARACEDRADSKNDKVSEIIDKIERKELDPNAGRVMIDAIKWQTAHERPKKYGEHMQIEHSGDISIMSAVASHLSGERGKK